MYRHEHPNWPYDIIATNYVNALTLRKSPFDVCRLLELLEPLQSLAIYPDTWRRVWTSDPDYYGTLTPEQCHRSTDLDTLRKTSERGYPGSRAAAWIARGILQDATPCDFDPHETVALAQAIAFCESGYDALARIHQLVNHPEAHWLNVAKQPFWNGDLVGYGRHWLNKRNENDSGRL